MNTSAKSPLEFWKSERERDAVSRLRRLHAGATLWSVYAHGDRMATLEELAAECNEDRRIVSLLYLKENPDAN